MVYLQPFLRLVAIGTLYVEEQFSFSMSLVGLTGGGGDPVPPSVPPGIETAFREFFATPGAFSPQTKLTMLKLNQIGTNGRYTQDESVELELDPPAAGVFAQYQAPQVSLVVSLETAKRRGRAHAGRFYLPAPCQLPNSQGILDDVARNVYKNATDTLLQAIQDELVGYRLGVVSNIGAGAQEYVTNARYGRVLDTQRSRRSSLEEDYVTGADLTV